MATATEKGPNEVNIVPFDFLSGGGEMGELIRSIDWTKTPIGPVSKWSPALRTMVGLLLRNRFPLLLWWGPRFVQIYNDAYRPIPGDKHPKSMGQPASECWAEIWHIIGPMIEAPFLGKEATTSDDLFLLINRKGFVEETHFKVAYSPVPDDTVRSTGIGGVLGTVAEITQQIIGERQLKTLRELGARAIDAKTPQQACETAVETLTDNSWDVPFALFYLLDETGTQAKLAASCGFKTNEQANPPYLDITKQDDSRAWQLKSVIEKRKIEVYSNLSQRLGKLPSGHWSEAPNTAIALPLASPDQPFPYGVLIAGISPHRELDESYRGFFELASSQVTTAIRNALAYQEERKRAENLAELDKAKTVFFSNVSHEFRTPLTLMLSPLEDMLSQPKSALDPANREQIVLIHRNSQRLLKLVNSLLDFSRIEAGRIQASYMPVDLSELTTDLVSVFRSAIEKAGLKLIVDCPKLPEPIYVDKDMWEKIVLNLVSNAFKFTFKGEITVALRWCGGHVELDVKDTGTGIAAKEMPRLFERFHRIRGVKGRSQEGTGIGLALVQELAKLHGGNVQASSTLGEGTTFTISIPTGYEHLPKEHVGAAKTLQSSATGAAPFVEEALGWLPKETSQNTNLTAEKELRLPQPKLSQKRAKILLADDNADMRDYVTRLLSYYFDVVAFADGKAALEAATKDVPDLVLTDIMMPNLDGFEFLRELRANAITKSIPVIFLSARAGEESRIEGLQAGADDYLVKPFSSKELIAKVESRLEIARLQAEAGEALHKSAAELARAQEIARTGSFTIDVQNNELSWSDECYRIFGINKEKTELTRDIFLSLIVPDERKAVDQAVQESIRTGQPYSIKYTVNRQDGASLIIHSEGQVVKDKNGKVIKVYGINQDITERKKAEEALKQSELRYRQLFGSMTEMFQIIELVFDKDGKAIDYYYRDVNPAFEKLVKKTREQLIDKRVKAIFGIVEDYWLEAYNRVAKTGNPAHFENYGAELDKWYDVYVWKANDKQVAITFTDITERKKAEEEIARSKELLVETEQTGNIGGWEFDVKTMKQTWTEQTFRILEVDTLHGEPKVPQGIEFINHPYRDMANQAIQRAIEYGEHYDQEWEVTTFKGNKRWVHSVGKVRKNNGVTVGLYGSFQDITERKKAEHDVLEQKLRAERYLNIVGNIILALDLDGKITLLNKKGYEMLGYDDGELDGKDWVEVALPTEIRGELRKVHQDSVQGKIKTPVSYENAIVTKFGEKRMVSWHNSEVRDENGQLIGTLSSGEDITIRKRAEEELEKYRINLEKLVEERTKQLKDSERLAAIGATAGMVGHDIRNPLQAITGDLYLVKTELAELPDHQQKKNAMESLDEIQNNIDYINKIVADLQDYARPLNPRAQEANLKAIFNDVLTKNGVPKNIKSEVKLEEKAEKIMADPDYLKRIAANLILNAVQAMPNGGKLMIHAFIDKQTNDTLITVKDTGVGIPEDVKPRLFTPMMTTKSKGQGFGLAVVKRMTEGLGGTVTFESQEGKGTTFIVRLPPKS